MKFNKIKVIDLAIMLKVHRTYIHAWMSGKNKPSENIMKEMRRVTLGAINTYEDLLNDKSGYK